MSKVPEYLVIAHRKQSLANNCVSASLAMVLDRRLCEVTKEFHEDYVNSEMEIHEYLDASGIPYRRCLADERAMTPGHVYLTAVPSINIPGGSHMLVIQVTNTGWYILDPNEGKEGVLAYGSYLPEEPPEGYRQLVSWAPCYEFTCDDVIAFSHGIIV